MKNQNIRNTNTKEKIINAFIALLKKKSIEDITIKTITEKAQINRATFYAHFEDKFYLFNYMTNSSIFNVVNESITHHSDSITNQIDNLFDSIINYLNNIKHNCPYSYNKLFPYLRPLFIDTITKKLNHIIKNEPIYNMLIAGAIFDAAEISLADSSEHSYSEIQEKLMVFINSYKNL
ncbi:TetR/AcrR family transcriptional regulator [Staphylococcus kloosii]|jgi:AcrR family transcriptional regulator|uniref:TetR/AcrR family transcriptional regulator n=1 Tax=Staphylococcus kloosii TaxID=29384 RepID=UPI00189FFC69|nr:TetR/AcrR family transcriptional regulator [Staphylococcus kloosii]MBF7025333.1 TetR/AcrR family transcriptional regulator [Staphylococcus kloosii]